MVPQRPNMPAERLEGNGSVLRGKIARELATDDLGPIGVPEASPGLLSVAADSDNTTDACRASARMLARPDPPNSSPWLGSRKTIPKPPPQHTLLTACSVLWSRNRDMVGDVR